MYLNYVETSAPASSRHNTGRQDAGVTSNEAEAAGLLEALKELIARKQLVVKYQLDLVTQIRVRKVGVIGVDSKRHVSFGECRQHGSQLLHVFNGMCLEV